MSRLLLAYFHLGIAYLTLISVCDLSCCELRGMCLNMPRVEHVVATANPCGMSKNRGLFSYSFPMNLLPVLHLPRSQWNVKDISHELGDVRSGKELSAASHIHHPKSRENYRRPSSLFSICKTVLGAHCGHLNRAASLAHGSCDDVKCHARDH